MGTTESTKVFIENKDIPWEQTGELIKEKLWVMITT